MLQAVWTGEGCTKALLVQARQTKDYFSVFNSVITGDEHFNFYPILFLQFKKDCIIKGSNYDMVHTVAKLAFSIHLTRHGIGHATVKVKQTQKIILSEFF